MNPSNKVLSLIVVTATAGLASFRLATTEVTARFPLETFLAVAVSLGVVRVAFSDYARRPKPLSVPAALLRPVPHRTVRVSAHIERVAA